MTSGGECMKIIFSLKESIYDCKLKITDTQGDCYYLIRAPKDNDTPIEYITVDVCGTEFDLELIPLFPDVDSALNEIDNKHWTDKFVKKAAKGLFESLEKMILRVGCNYHISKLQDGDRLDINLQCYTFGTFDRYNILEMIPMMYMFFDVCHFNKRFTTTKAFETNRKDVLKSAKIWALSDGFVNGLFLGLLTYPIQVGRIRHLSKNKKINKVIHKLCHMSEIERQKIFAKQEEFFNS